MNWKDEYQALTGETPQFVAARLQKLIVGWMVYQTKHPFPKPETSLRDALSAVADWIRCDRLGASDWNSFCNMALFADKAVSEAREYAYRERDCLNSQRRGIA